jgi:hypothetical protein
MSDCKHCHGPHDVQRHAQQKPLHEAGKKCGMCDQVDHDAHLADAKKRALAWLPQNPAAAISTMVKQLLLHPDWQDPMARALCVDAARFAGDARAAREWIEGWN